jgi:hypothetical protein
VTTWPATSDAGDPTAVRHRTTTVDGLSLFYREAGDRRHPTLVLLHGFPSSSVMFRDLMPRLADRFHLLAPDFPGFGRSEAPPPHAFRYTFDHLAEVVDHFLEQRGPIATRCTSRTTAARSDSASPWPIPSGCARWSSRTRSRTSRGCRSSGHRAGHSGPIAGRTRPRCARTCSLWPPRGYGTSVAVPIPSGSTQTPGRASTHFSPGPAWWISTSTCSTTIEPTSRPTRGGRRIFASGSRRRWWCGASTTSRSRWPVRWPSARTWPPPRCTCSTRDILPWTRPHRRSPS